MSGGCMLKKIIPAVSAAVFSFAAAGCSHTQDNTSSEPDVKPVQSTVRTDDSGSVKLKDYTAPELLTDVPEADVLSDVVYRSFDPAAVLTEPERQPVDGYKCTGFFNNMCYIFKKGDNYGLLSLAGVVLLEPDGITKITAESPDLLAVRRSGEPKKLYRISYDGAVPVQDKKFDPSRISFETTDGDTVYRLRVDGKDIYSADWSRWKDFSQIDPETLDTQTQEDEAHSCHAVYLASNERGEFYLSFDKYYNLTVCRAELGSAEVRIDGQYGRFYITDPVDEQDLNTLVNAFGDEPGSAAPLKNDSSADYVRLVFGRDSDPDKAVYTFSPDGYCFSEISSGENGRRYFRKMSPDTFTDLVYWINKKLNTASAKNGS